MPLQTTVLPTEALSSPLEATSLEVQLVGYQEVSRKHVLDDVLHGFRLHFIGGLKMVYIPATLFQRLSTPI